MTTPGFPRGMTLQVHVGDVHLGREFYAKVFGREPDFAPHDDFLEWQVVSDHEVWWQVVGAAAEVPALATRVRFTVPDVVAAAEWARGALGVEPSPVTWLPGVVAFTDFDDPWGNRLGFYEDLLPSGEQLVPGGSVRDESHYRDEPPDTPQR